MLGMAVAEPAAALAGHQHVRRHIDQHRQRRLVERDFDLLALAGAGSCIERREDRVAGQHAGADIDDRDAVLGRPAVGCAGDAHQPGLGLQDEVVAGERRFRSARAVTGDRAAHQLRRVLLEPRVGEAPLVERADLEVVHQHVGLRDQRGEHLLSRLRRHVERDRTLVAVDAEKIRGLARGKRRSPGAGVVAGAGRLHLDDLGAHVAEHHGAERPGQDAREIEHARAGHRAGRGLRHRAAFLARIEGGALRSRSQPSR